MTSTNFNNMNPYGYPYYEPLTPNLYKTLSDTNSSSMDTDLLFPELANLNSISNYPLSPHEISCDLSEEKIDKPSNIPSNARGKKRKLQEDTTTARKYPRLTFSLSQKNSEENETQEEHSNFQLSNNLTVNEKNSANKKFHQNRTKIKNNLIEILRLQDKLYPNPILKRKMSKLDNDWNITNLNIPLLFYNISKEYVRGFLKLSVIYSSLETANKNSRETGNRIRLNSLKLTQVDEVILNKFNNKLQVISTDASVKKLKTLSKLHVYLFPSSNLNNEISKIKATDRVPQALTLMAKELEEEVNKIKNGIKSLLNGKSADLPTLIAQDSATDSFVDKVFPHNFPFIDNLSPSNPSKGKQVQVEQASKDLDDDVAAMILTLHADLFPLIKTNEKKPKNLADLQRILQTIKKEVDSVRRENQELKKTLPSQHSLQKEIHQLKQVNQELKTTFPSQRNLQKEIHQLKQVNQALNQRVLQQENQMLRQQLAATAQNRPYFYSSPYGMPNI